MAKHRRHSMEKSGSSMEPKRIEGLPETMAVHSQMSNMGKSYYGDGYGEHANMPMAPKMQMYPQPYKTLEAEAYPDNIREIDTDAMANLKMVHDHMSDSMY